MKEISCNKCPYIWGFKGKLGIATCPNCGAKIKIQGEPRAGVNTSARPQTQ